MSAMGGYGWLRAKNPGMFWFAATFNVLVFLTGLILLFEELTR
jgi:hypothetical protein